MSIHVWIKVTPNGRPTKIACEPDDDIDTLQRKIKEQLSSKFGHVDCDEIIVRDANGEVIDPDVRISSLAQSLGCSSKLPFFVDGPVPQASSIGKVTFSTIPLEYFMRI
jgi:hypothetical protein